MTSDKARKWDFVCGALCLVFLFSFISVHPLSNPKEGKEHKEDEKKGLEIKGEENNNSMWITADLCEECRIARLILLSAWLRLHVILRRERRSERESMRRRRRQRGGRGVKWRVKIRGLFVRHEDKLFFRRLYWVKRTKYVKNMSRSSHVKRKRKEIIFHSKFLGPFALLLSLHSWQLKD